MAKFEVSRFAEVVLDFPEGSPWHKYVVLNCIDGRMERFSFGASTVTRVPT